MTILPDELQMLHVPNTMEGFIISASSLAQMNPFQTLKSSRGSDMHLRSCTGSMLPRYLALSIFSCALERGSCCLKPRKPQIVTLSRSKLEP